MPNVFISHRGADTAQAERLAKDIQSHGHAVWLDHWEIDVGDSIVGKIEQGLAGSNYLILCVSSIGTSAWMNREWMSALARQLEGKGVKVLPVKLDVGELPTILADIKYADLGADWLLGVTALLKAVR